MYYYVIYIDESGNASVQAYGVSDCSSNDDDFLTQIHLEHVPLSLPDNHLLPANVGSGPQPRTTLHDPLRHPRGQPIDLQLTATRTSQLVHRVKQKVTDPTLSVP